MIEVFMRLYASYQMQNTKRFRRQTYHIWQQQDFKEDSVAHLLKDAVERRDRH